MQSLKKIHEWAQMKVPLLEHLPYIHLSSQVGDHDKMMLGYFLFTHDNFCIAV